MRIVNVSSRAHLRNRFDGFKVPTIDFEDVEGKKNYNPLLQYSISKLANVLFTQELAERVSRVNKNARVVSLHPGVVRTEIARNVEWWKKAVLVLVYPIFSLFTKDTTSGAQTTIYSCL